jgi:hypothetical protein
MSEFLKQYTNRVGKPLLRSSGVHFNIAQTLAYGRKVRDVKLWDWPIVPGAVSIYIDIASSRQWTLSGKPRAVARAVEMLNNTLTYDVETGQSYYGFDQFEQRRALDSLAVGRTAMLLPNPKRRMIEYLDPTLLTRLQTPSLVVRPGDFAWEYADGRKFRAGEIVLHHPIPVGTSGFVAPLTPLTPTATLAWLIREHDSAKLDGRKLRDILFVGNAEMASAIEEAVVRMAALWSGADPASVGGVPLVEINNPSGSPVANQIFRLGLSEIPENFDRVQFINEYVNQIAAHLGLSLRHFWNNETTTNRALEEVQEARQQQKGPAMFVRAEQRILNNSGALDVIADRGTLRFSYQEETDAGSQLTHAQVLNLTANSLEKISTLFGASIDLSAYLAWMQSLGLLPNDIELIKEQPSDTQQPIQRAESDPQPFASGESRLVSSDQDNPLTKTALLQYGEVTMDLNGNLLDRRVKMFRAVDLFTDAPAPLPDDEKIFVNLASETARENNLFLLKVIDRLPDEAVSMLRRFKNGETLSEAEQTQLDLLYLEYAYESSKSPSID